MTNHAYLCSCHDCEYERIMSMIQGKYRDRSNNNYREEPVDPFAPSNITSVYYCDTCQSYQRSAHEHVTGRFKVQQPRYQQKPRETKQEIQIQGEFRRYRNDASDMIQWQYRPWPDAEWHTYFSVTMELFTTTVKRHDSRWAARQFHLNADKTIQEERFYKVERVD